MNEHFTDVFGVLVKQWKKKQTAAQADWLIGGGIMGPATKAKSLRTFKAEKAFEDDPLLGTDPQPKHMKQKYKGSADNGGVHINSGIPNHAFYLTAMRIGGRARLRAGRIWCSRDKFDGLDDALAHCRRLFPWYNNEHHHSSLGYLTPTEVHFGVHGPVLAQRPLTLALAFELNPNRFVKGVSARQRTSTRRPDQPTEEFGLHN